MTSEHEQTALRLELDGCCLVSTGFRILVAGRASLDVDGDLLWALEQRVWKPLAVDIQRQAKGLWVTPLVLDRQAAFSPREVLGWRDAPVWLGVLDGVQDIPEALRWWQAALGVAQIVPEAWDVASYGWGVLLSLQREALGLEVPGVEYLLLPIRGAAIHLGYLALDWRRVHIEPAENL
ncbi:MAG: hypothetical protein GAK43_00484 [Stenotrophomonas maltophilia]|nr:MAG: hypothetical protein GAK43_00484 [Stenotrophomonas maltophilia]